MLCSTRHRLGGHQKGWADTKEMEEKLQQKLDELSEDTQSSPQVVEESPLTGQEKKKPEELK